MSAYDDNDPTAARLRAALNAEAAMVTPSDNLDEIRSRTRGGRPRRLSVPLLAAAAAVVVLLAVGGVVWLGGGDRDGNVVANNPTTSAPATPTPSETQPPSPSPTPSAEQSVWVYYVMDDPVSGPRLYREQVAVSSPDEPVVAALKVMLGQAADDPDYYSSWPDRSWLKDYSLDGSTATVNLSVPDGTDWPTIAEQQLVYTVTANDERAQQVNLLINGRQKGNGLTRAPMVDVQGLIWLLSPSEGESVSSPVRIEGYGTAFEGTVSWEVRQDGKVVAEGFTQGGSMGEFGDFSDSVELPPGDYELRAFESSAEDGRPIHVDTKSFTVR